MGNVLKDHSTYERECPLLKFHFIRIGRSYLNTFVLIEGDDKEMHML